MSFELSYFFPLRIFHRGWFFSILKAGPKNQELNNVKHEP